jgi:hypothetical protein
VIQPFHATLTEKGLIVCSPVQPHQTTQKERKKETELALFFV